MRPAFKGLNLLIIDKDKQPETGDVAYYRNDEDLPVYHRVVGQIGDTYILKGDNNHKATSIRREEIKGVIVYSQRLL